MRERGDSSRRSSVKDGKASLGKPLTADREAVGVAALTPRVTGGRHRLKEGFETEKMPSGGNRIVTLWVKLRRRGMSL